MGRMKELKPNQVLVQTQKLPGLARIKEMFMNKLHDLREKRKDFDFPDEPKLFYDKKEKQHYWGTFLWFDLPHPTADRKGAEIPLAFAETFTEKDVWVQMMCAFEEFRIMAEEHLQMIANNIVDPGERREEKNPVLELPDEITD